VSASTKNTEFGRPRQQLQLLRKGTVDLLPHQKSLYASHRAAKYLVTAFRLLQGMTLKCHSAKSGTRFCVREIAITWSPLTESNRRPSPYHGPPVGPCRRRIGPHQGGHQLPRAQASTREPALAAFCPLNCPRGSSLADGRPTPPPPRIWPLMRQRSGAIAVSDRMTIGTKSAAPKTR